VFQICEIVIQEPFFDNLLKILGNGICNTYHVKLTWDGPNREKGGRMEIVTIAGNRPQTIKLSYLSNFLMTLTIIRCINGG
jgi:hypothetical protein